MTTNDNGLAQVDFESDRLPPQEFETYWKRKHAVDDYEHPDPSEHLLRTLQTFLGTGNGYVLDHGCGSGRLALRLAELGHLVALNDISPRALDSTRRRFEAAGLENRIVYEWLGQIQQSVPRDDGWGAFLSHRVLHALPRRSREAAIITLATYLHPGGRGVAVARSILCTRLPHIRADHAFRPIDGTGRTFVRREPFRFLHFFSSGELEQSFQRAGLDVIHTESFRERTGNLQRPHDTETNAYWLVLVEKPKAPKEPMPVPLADGMLISGPANTNAIKSCLFDLDGTLMWSPLFNSATREQAVCCIRSELGLAELHAGELLENRRSALTTAMGYTPALSATLVSLGIPLQVWAEYQSRVNVEALVQRDDEVCQTLSELAKQFPLFIYTNMARRLAERAISHLGFQRSIARLFCSEDIGVPKPSNEAIRLIAASMGFEIPTIVAIGDRFNIDLRPLVTLGGCGMVADSRSRLLACCRWLLSTRGIPK